jgi:hypothetical protein
MFLLGFISGLPQLAWEKGVDVVIVVNQPLRLSKSQVVLLKFHFMIFACLANWVPILFWNQGLLIPCCSDLYVRLLNIFISILPAVLQFVYDGVGIWKERIWTFSIRRSLIASEEVILGFGIWFTDVSDGLLLRRNLCALDFSLCFIFLFQTMELFVQDIVCKCWSFSSEIYFGKICWRASTRCWLLWW